MDIQEYVTSRVENQIKWYSDKSTKCQRKYKTIQITEIVLASVIPVLSGYTDIKPVIPLLIGVLGAIIAILESITKLCKYHENWIEYRSTSELLKYHKFLYETQSSPYNTKEDTVDNLFIKNMEQIISSENNQWKTLNATNQINLPNHSTRS